MKIRAYAVLIALAACGDEKVTIETDEPPALLAFRNEADAQWQVLATAGKSSFEIAPAGPYRVVAACAQGLISLPRILEIARTLDDDRLIEYSCRSRPFIVSGQMQQSGSVGVGNVSSANPTGPWTFRLPMSAGTFDLVMLARESAGYSQVAIRRDVAISADTDVGVLDLASENAKPLIPVSFTATNRESIEVRSSFMVVYAGNTAAGFFTGITPDTWDTVVIPDGVLRSTDRQNIVLDATTTSGNQSRVREIRRDVHPGTATSVTLPAHIGSMQFEVTAGRLAATWSSIPEYDRLLLTWQGRSVAGQPQMLQQLIVSRSFIDATRTTSVVLDLDNVPGVTDQWRIDPSSFASRQLSAIRGSSTADMATSTVRETQGIPVGRIPDAHPLVGLDLAAPLDDRRLFSRDIAR